MCIKNKDQQISDMQQLWIMAIILNLFEKKLSLDRCKNFASNFGLWQLYLFLLETISLDRYNLNIA